MAASSSSSLSSEKEAIFHPYQDNKAPGPKGAYEARQVKDGFYVRIDMPGVPPDGVKLFKYTETRTVTFTGKAPKHWVFDSSERVYGGYVVLDRDPNDVEVEMTVKNGSLKLFFRDAEGSLHFFSSKNSAQNVNGEIHQQENAGSNSMILSPCGYSSSEQVDHEPNVIIGHVGIMRRHPPKCSCCKGKRESVSVSKIQEFSHINPYLLNGVRGVSEIRLVRDGSGGCLYMRVDMPGVSQNRSVLLVNHDKYMVYGEDGHLKSYMMCGGDTPEEHRLDKHGRCYLFCVILQCSCCMISNVVEEMKDGVFRVSFQKVLDMRKATASSC